MNKVEYQSRLFPDFNLGPLQAYTHIHMKKKSTHIHTTHTHALDNGLIKHKALTVASGVVMWPLLTQMWPSLPLESTLGPLPLIPRLLCCPGLSFPSCKPQPSVFRRETFPVFLCPSSTRRRQIVFSIPALCEHAYASPGSFTTVGSIWRNAAPSVA